MKCININDRTERVLAYSFILLLLCFLRIDIFEAAYLVPINDYAANDLLIRDAVDFNLLHGNYSRVGFYHPGPFFFQLMAFFELIFYKWVPVFSSPIQAHVFAILNFSSLAFSLIYFCFKRIVHNRTTALAMFFVFLVTNIYVIDTREYYNSQYYFLSTWPPFLYMSAATFFVGGVIFMYSGYGIGWGWSTFGLMALFHGHASFIGLIPIMIFFGLVPLSYFFLQNNKTPKINEYLRCNLKYFFASALIIILFAFPVVINTIFNWPGEIPKYFSFAESSSRHWFSAGELINFWKRFIDLKIFFAITFGFCVCVFFEKKHRKTFIALVLVTFPAAFFYSVRGLDTLIYKYPLFWIAPTIGCLTALSFYFTLTQIRNNNAKYFFMILTLIPLCYQLHYFQYRNNYDSIEGVEFKNALKTLRNGMKKGELVAISIGDNPSSIVYTLILLSIDNREKYRGLCINKKYYNVAYTQKYICGEHDNVLRNVSIREFDEKSTNNYIAHIQGIYFYESSSN